MVIILELGHFLLETFVVFLEKGLVRFVIRERWWITGIDMNHVIMVM